MWNERFAQPGYLFGTEPAQFLRDHGQYLTPGLRVLAVADGEGRNSVFLANQGLNVTALDGSSVAVDKARALADERGAKVDFNIADIMEWDWQSEAYDLVVAIFIQFSAPQEREKVFAGLKKTLKKGGILMLHGYTVEQLEHGTGGPPCAENLYTTELLKEAFSDMEILHLNAYERDVDEGRAHSGRSSLIDLIARKK